MNGFNIKCNNCGVETKLIQGEYHGEEVIEHNTEGNVQIKGWHDGLYEIECKHCSQRIAGR